MMAASRRHLLIGKGVKITWRFTRKGAILNKVVGKGATLPLFARIHGLRE